MSSSAKALDPAFQGAGQRVYPFIVDGDSIKMSLGDSSF